MSDATALLPGWIFRPEGACIVAELHDKEGRLVCGYFADHGSDEIAQVVLWHLAHHCLAERRRLAAAPTPADASCAECGKRDCDGWALYCVACAEKAFVAPGGQR